MLPTGIMPQNPVSTLEHTHQNHQSRSGKTHDAGFLTSFYAELRIRPLRLILCVSEIHAGCTERLTLGTGVKRIKLAKSTGAPRESSSSEWDIAGSALMSKR